MRACVLYYNELLQKMPLPGLAKTRNDCEGQRKNTLPLYQLPPAKRMESNVDAKTRNILTLLAQHVHEICCHQFDGSDETGNPVIGEVHFSECEAEPCNVINHNLKAISVG